MPKIVLKRAARYMHGNFMYLRDEPVDVSDEVFDYLIEQEDTKGVPFFKEVRAARSLQVVPEGQDTPAKGKGGVKVTRGGKAAEAPVVKDEQSPQTGDDTGSEAPETTVEV